MQNLADALLFAAMYEINAAHAYKKRRRPPQEFVDKFLETCKASSGGRDFFIAVMMAQENVIVKARRKS